MISGSMADTMGETSRLFDSHRGRLTAFVAARMPPLLARAVPPEDIVQETFLEATRRYEEFEPTGPSAFYRWLVAIARYKIAEAVRARRAKKRAVLTPMEMEPTGNQTSPSGRAIRAERAGLVANAIDALPPDQARAVRLRYLEGLSVAETADRLDRSPAAVKMLVSRGLAALADEVGSRF
jgi:RNA polymerase sigma-70 factor (ECF subfamily)